MLLRDERDLGRRSRRLHGVSRLMLMLVRDRDRSRCRSDC
jgi:hypothetical protein